MRTKLATLNRKVRAIRAALSKVALARLPLRLQRYAESGELPDDAMAAAYVTLADAAAMAMDSSIGGDGHEAACQEYETAATNWKETLREAGL